jgi:2'-5' RNA ligase
MIRAFIAVDSQDDLVEKIRDVQKGLRGFNLRFVDPSQIHMTMKFLGDVPEEMIKEISNALDDVTHDAFVADICGVGAFPSQKRIRVVWVGARDDGEFDVLHEKIESSLTPLGFAREKFTTHITIARAKKLLKDEMNSLSRRIYQLRDVEIGKMEVHEVKLKKSTLTPKGPIYEDLHIKTLE